MVKFYPVLLMGIFLFGCEYGYRASDHDHKKNPKNESSNEEKEMDPIQGKFKVVEVLCGDQVSTIFTDDTFSSGKVISTAEFVSFEENKRTVTIGKCIIETPFKVEVASKSALRLIDGASSCEVLEEKACEPYAALCDAKGGEPALFPYKMDANNRITFEIPDDRSKGHCAEAQPQHASFVYEQI